MRAFKAFNSDMTCTLGKGKYQYAEGETFTESRAQAHETGFHCAEYILDCLNYYPESKDIVICPVEALGDIDEDGQDTKISCTILKVGQRLTWEEVVLEAIRYLIRHPKFRDPQIKTEEGKSSGAYCIVRGKSPVAAGAKGTILGMIQEDPHGKVQSIAIYKVNGKEIRPGRYYDIDGKEVKDVEKDGTEKTAKVKSHDKNKKPRSHKVQKG